MRDQYPLSRRGFITSAGATGAGLFLRLGAPALAAVTQAACSAREDEAVFVALGAEDARDFAAIAARIIPTTDTPGATEAGVIHFLDQAFASDMARALPYALDELGRLNASLGGRFAGLDATAQDAALAKIEHEPFFALTRTMTIFGFFAMSSYGGNRGHVGWDLIGFDGHHGAWQYPFGYYDAEVHGGGADGQ